MSTITLRSVKGSPLTNNEVDANFSNLNTDKYQAGDSPDFVATLTDKLGIDTTAVVTPGVGEFGWDDGNGTVSLGLKGGNVNLQLGQEIVARCYNDSGVALSDGQIVYISGSQGNRVAVKLALATTDGTSAGTLGMVTEPIAIGAEGFITVMGTVNKLNTSGLTQGAIIYLSPTVAGAYTTTKPVAPQHTVTLGYVERVHATVGSIYVKVDNGYELDELHNVLITSPTSGNTLIYDAVAGVWKNANITGGTGLSVTNGAGTIALANTGVTSVAAGAGISVSDTTGAITVTNSDRGSSQNIFKNIAVSGQSTVVADSNDDTVTFANGTGISITTNDATDTITIANTGVTAVNGVTGEVTATNLLNAIKTVDGVGSGLDADLLDGNSSAFFQQALVSGTNIKTVNSTSLLGSGNVSVGTVTSVAAGNGMNFTTITGTGTVTMGTPSSITNTTTNSASGTTHTHELTGELVQTTTGSALYYGARAWVSFNGSGTVAIYNSSNVTSITDNATGAFIINFATSMPDADYAVIGTGSGTDSASAERVFFPIEGTFLTSSVKIRTSTAGGTAQDPVNVSVAIFR